MSQTERLAPRRDVIAATVRPAEREEVLAAFATAGWARASTGARVVLLAYTREPRIRDLVTRWLREHAAEVL